MAGSAVKRGFVVSFFIIFFLLVFAGFGRSYVSINLPPGNDLGKFLNSRPLTADFNITFDEPLPLGPGETTLTARISHPDGRLYDERIIPLAPLLERYGVVYNGQYVYRPRFFEYDVTLTGKNVTYEGVSFDYTIQQTRRTSPTGTGDGKWKITGRDITDSDGDGSALTGRYCSGPWDFYDGMPSTGYLCDSPEHKTSCGSTPGGNGDDNGDGEIVYCCIGNACVQTAEEYCDAYPDYTSCTTNQDCIEPVSFPAGTEILLPSGTKGIELVGEGEEILSFEGEEIVERKVSGVIAHPSDHYYVLKTANREVRATGNHEFYTGNGEFRSVYDLTEGEEVYVLWNGELVPEEIVYKEFVPVETEVYDLAVEGTHNFFANGFAVHNRVISLATGNAVPIQRLSWDPNSTADTNYQVLLYYEDLDSKDVPNDPGISLVDGIYCQTSHSWLFETYIYPSVTKTASFKIYPDSGARIYLDRASANAWTTVNSRICLNGCETTAGVYSGYCKWEGVQFQSNTWYRLRVYLFNNPGGLCTKKDPPTGNPMGIRIEDFGSPETSLRQEFGQDSIINSQAPGPTKTIQGSSRIIANEGLKEIVDVSAYNVDYTVGTSSPYVKLSMRQVCGNAVYESNMYTDSYGWITDRILKTYSWTIDGNDRLGTLPKPFDESSVTGVNRNLFRPDGNEIGGIYKCLENWPTWTRDCASSDRYFDSTHNRYCCRKPSHSLELDGDSGMIRIENYESFYTYMINYLPASGGKLCAYTERYGSETPVNYVSRYLNSFCNEETLKNCCYCNKDFGCTLDCRNQENMSGGYFPPPFDMSGPGWEIVNPEISVGSYDPNMEFVVTGDSQIGWTLQANFLGTGEQRLYKNYTIPVNLNDDFGFVSPPDTGVYSVRLTLNYVLGSRTANGFFEVAECLKPGEKSTYYDEKTYPGTKNVGECRPGTRTCGSDNMWFYQTLQDRPVYPGYEVCNGRDDDCNGVVDDIGGFDNIISEFIRSGGKKTPKQITKCGCFGGAKPADEICNNIDDDCDGTIDNSEKVVNVNTCDELVMQCESEGSPYTWCLQFYNASTCSLKDITFKTPAKLFSNSCTERVKKCMDNARYNTVTGRYEPFTYNDCKHLYYKNDCFLGEKEVKTLGNTCYCSGGLNADPSIVTETCNGVDDDCNGIIDDVQYPETCACAFRGINKTMFYKGSTDYSCDGIDSNCNGIIDDFASLCACRGRNPVDALRIKLEGKDICDYMDNDCDGLVDEGFPNLGKSCGYGVCSGGAYVCNFYGDGEVCNTTVNPEDTYLGNARKYKTSEICDLKDNDCDGSIDEDNCMCTPSDIGVSRICGYESGIYYNNLGEIDVICDDVMEQISKLISWAEAPGNTFYRRLMVIENENNVDLANYPASITINTGELITDGKLRADGGDLRIREREEEEHIDWFNTNTFTSHSNTIWFRADIPKNSEKHYYLYYGDPSATYSTPGATQVLGLQKLRETLLLCHFDGTSGCEGNIIASTSSGVSYPAGKYGQGISLSSSGAVTYPTSENMNKERGSIGIWVKPDDVTREHQLFYLEDFTGQKQFSLYFSPEGTFFEVYDMDGIKNSVKAGPLNTNWNHILVTWDVLYGIRIYLNGNQAAYKTAKWEMKDLGIDMHLGSMGPEKILEGVMDEFVVYSRALPEEDAKRDFRAYDLAASLGAEENLNNTVTVTTSEDVYNKCTQFLSNVTQTLTDESVMYTILSLCDSVRICDKTFPINSTSVCMVGTQTCSGGYWSGCTGILPTTEVCNNKDDDCNGIIDDVSNPETCACAYGGQPGEEECNGIDDNCNVMVDDVRGGDSKEETHCGCFGEQVNITQKVLEPENPKCNGIDDNCDGIIDEDVAGCACSYTIFTPSMDNLTSSKRPEDCDNVDDDCNGIRDDPYQEDGSAVGSNYLGADCGPPNSRCAGGKYVCSDNGLETVCDTMSGEGLTGDDLRVPEICNAIDDDCNIIIDDVWGGDSGEYCQCYQGIPESVEVCDGMDNDCDGTVDNVENPGQCACYTSLQLNTSNLYAIDSNITARKSSKETCNNIDDNCNRRIDEGLDLTCFCSGGFEGDPRLRPELCNGADDNCNGVVDDVTFSDTCSCYNGSRSKGELSEICDGSDNDCNGLIDETWLELGSACGFGICSGGVYECTTDGSSVVCSTIGGSLNKASTEACDNIDNDCDFVTDEGCPCSPGDNKTCGIDQGVCERGYQACINGQWSNCIGGKGPGKETCNGMDDNCDGVTDNVGGGTSVKSARCACYGGAAKSDEKCDGLDNDCDGTIDNVDGGNSIAASKCACFDGKFAPRANLEVCNAIDDDCDGVTDNVKGGMSTESTGCGCFGGAPKTNEICNRIDDDCDGTVDNAWPNIGDRCGLGVCTGVYVCSEEGSSAICEGGNPSPEVYDGKDNDCNGIVDDIKGEPFPVCGNQVCETTENNANCPEDCPDGEPPQPLPGTWILVFIAIIVIIIIVGIALTFMK